MSRITGRKLPQGKVQKATFLCEDGPYKGEYLRLTVEQGFAGTMTFRANGQHGRYAQDGGRSVVVWQPYAKPA